MNLAVIGSGGREHAICYKLKQSPKIKKLICIPGNAGTQKIAENVKEDASKKLVKIPKFAVGILFFLHKFFMKAFEPSNCEANLSGPNTLTFFSLK